MAFGTRNQERSAKLITTSKLINKIAVRSQIPRDTVRHVLGVLSFEIVDQLSEGMIISLANLGEFRPVYHPSRNLINSKGEKKATTPTHRIQFRAYPQAKKVMLAKTNASSK